MYVHNCAASAARSTGYSGAKHSWKPHKGVLHVVQIVLSVRSGCFDVHHQVSLKCSVYSTPRTPPRTPPHTPPPHTTTAPRLCCVLAPTVARVSLHGTVVCAAMWGLYVWHHVVLPCTTLVHPNSCVPELCGPKPVVEIQCVLSNCRSGLAPLPRAVVEARDPRLKPNKQNTPALSCLLAPDVWQYAREPVLLNYPLMVACQLVSVNKYEGIRANGQNTTTNDSTALQRYCRMYLPITTTPLIISISGDNAPVHARQAHFLATLQRAK